MTWLSIALRSSYVDECESPFRISHRFRFFGVIDDMTAADDVTGVDDDPQQEKAPHMTSRFIQIGRAHV